MNKGTTTGEEGLEAPTRHAIDWQNPDFYNEALLDTELRRVFDVCHSCRRCFNLCDSFPRLFDLIDESPTGELDSVHSEAFGHVVDACTLCDMCYMTKCPYVPPHSFDIDFPHLMLRYRAQKHHQGQTSWHDKVLSSTDALGRLGQSVAPLANHLTATTNTLARTVIDSVMDIHPKAELPSFAGKTLCKTLKKTATPINPTGPALGQKVVLYATCYGNYNQPVLGVAAQAVLAHQGIEVVTLHPGCCGMPKWEHGDLQNVSLRALHTAKTFEPWIDKGFTILALLPSCALMLKHEWPLLMPNEPLVQKLARSTEDVCAFLLNLARQPVGLAPGLRPLGQTVWAHLACHARAQNLGPVAADLLKLIPEADVKTLERCSGHGGSWGVRARNFPLATKMARSTVRPVQTALSKDPEDRDGHEPLVVSECPLAAQHLHQTLRESSPPATPNHRAHHPLELLAQAYGLLNLDGAKD